MQDRFKFRYWNKTCKCFFVNFKNDKDDIFGSLHIFEDVVNDDDYVVMQCTGLKDKNGKLIYEGDIVNYNDDAFGLCKAKIEWDNARYRIVYYAGDVYKWMDTILCLKHLRKLEVIDNIYENPELIKEAQ